MFDRDRLIGILLAFALALVFWLLLIATTLHFDKQFSKKTCDKNQKLQSLEGPKMKDERLTGESNIAVGCCIALEDTSAPPDGFNTAVGCSTVAECGNAEPATTGTNNVMFTKDPTRATKIIFIDLRTGKSFSTGSK